MVERRTMVQVQLYNHGSCTMVQNYGYTFAVIQPWYFGILHVSL